LYDVHTSSSEASQVMTRSSFSPGLHDSAVFTILMIFSVLLSISPTFYVQIFHANVVLASFSNYVLALSKNSYEKHAHIVLMKLTTSHQCLFALLRSARAKAASKMLVNFANIYKQLLCQYSFTNKLITKPNYNWRKALIQKAMRKVLGEIDT